VFRGSTASCARQKATAGWRCWVSGMVHPKVLQAGGIDPNELQAFCAFGMGINAHRDAEITAIHRPARVL